MPLVNVRATTAVADRFPADTAVVLATAVLDGLGLPQTDFFRGATWVYVEANADARTSSGLPGQPAGVVVELVVLGGITDAARNRALSHALTEQFRAWTGEPELTVWFVVSEVPEGSWGMNGALTELAAINALC